MRKSLNRVSGDRWVETYILFMFLSLAIRISLSPLDGYYIDLNTFTSWFYTASHGAVLDFYRNIWCDYPPFNVVIFWFFGNIARRLSLFGTSSLLYVLKLPSNLFDLGISTLVFTHFRKRTDARWALAVSATYIFNPATIFNSSIWGQFDAIYTFFVISSLILILEDRPMASFIVFGLAVLSKHQALVFLPVILLLLMKRFSWKEIIQSLTAFTATGLLFFIPFNWTNPIDLGLRIYLGGYGQYNYASLNAFNLWALLGFDVKDNQAIFSFITYQVIGWIILISIIFLILYFIDTDSPSKPNNFLMIYLTSILYFAFFMFLTRIHERYLFPVIALNLFSLTYDRKSGWLYAVLTATFLFNQAYALHFLNKRMFVPNGDPLAIAASLVNLAAFSFSLYILISKEGLKRKI